MGYFFIFAALFVQVASAQDTATQPWVRRQLPECHLLTWDFKSLVAAQTDRPFRLPTFSESLQSIRPSSYVTQSVATTRAAEVFDFHFEPNGKLSAIRRKPRLGEGPPLKRLWYGLTKNYSLATFGFGPVHRYSLDEIAVLNRDVRYSSISVGTSPYGNRMAVYYSRSPSRLIKIFLKPAKNGLLEEFRPRPRLTFWRKH